MGTIENDRSERIKILKEIFNNTLIDKQGDDLYEDLLLFFQDIVKKAYEKEEFNLVVFMARKAWCLFHVFLSVMDYDEDIKEEIKKRCAHDGMLAPHFSKYYNTDGNYDDAAVKRLKIAVVDDTCIRGDTINKCVRRLCYCFGVQPDNITFFAYAIHGSKQNEQRLLHSGRDTRTGYSAESDQAVARFKILANKDFNYGSDDPKHFLYVRWGVFSRNRSLLKGLDEIKMLTRRFVEAIQTCSIPYVGFTPAFSISFAKAKNIFGNLDDIAEDDYLQQDSLKRDFDDNNYEFYNITSQPMYHNDVEAFVLFPKKDIDSFKWTNADWLPFKFESSQFSPCIRFYINRQLKKVLILPFVGIPPVSQRSNLGNFFPEDLQKLFRNDRSIEGQKAANEAEAIYEGTLAAHRLLSYTVNYIFAKKFLDAIELMPSNDKNDDKIDYKLENMSGLPNESDFCKWVVSNEKDVCDVLNNIWEKLTIEKENMKKQNITVEVFHYDKNFRSDTEVPSWKKSTTEFNAIFDEVFDVELNKINPSYYTLSSIFFKKLSELDEVVKGTSTFRGVLVSEYAFRLSSKSECLRKSPNKIMSIILMLCDAGEVSMYVYQRHKTIGTYLADGEQCKLAYYLYSPSYAIFLRRLEQDISSSQFNVTQLKSIGFREDIRKHFEDKQNKEPEACHIPIDVLLQPLDNLLEENTENNDAEYFFSPPKYNEIADGSSLFFDVLFDKLRISHEQNNLI